MGIGRARRFASALLVLALLLTLTGCGGGSELKTGRKIIQKYLSGRSAEILECYVEMLRPEGMNAVSSDFVKGVFRIDGVRYDFAVNTVTGALYTSERMPEFSASCGALLALQLGLNTNDCLTDCRMTLYAQPWETPREEWPWERSCLGPVLPVDLADMDAYAAQAISNENITVRLYVACRSSELYKGRWTEEDLKDWNDTQAELFGFAPDEPLPTSETFPGAYHSVSDRPRMTLRQGNISYRPVT